LISKKETAKNVLEVGIDRGGSIKLWSEFFTNATVYGLDIINSDAVWKDIKNRENIVLYTETDAYNNDFFTEHFLNKNIKFDFMLDDGPHTLESMIQFIKLYSQIMTDDGILIIEDVQSLDWIHHLKNAVPDHLKRFINIYDLRKNKYRWDDIVFTISKTNIVNEVNQANESKKIVLVSGHYPKDTYYATQTKLSIEKYANIHGYNFYYNEDIPEDKSFSALHFYRCAIIQNASLKYPDAEWFLWLDSDVYVNNYNLKIEEQINLTDENILYHLFHENDWGCYPINTGVKFVHKNALKYEKEVWSLKDTEPWNTFPFEQKTIYEHILPQIPNKYIIHDPYVLNCIIKAYPSKIENALFVHMCGTPENERNEIIRNTVI
jgi:hypothetical protein